MSGTIVWFRQDLRLSDNPAIAWAVKRGEPIIPVFVLPDASEETPWSLGAASRWWLHHSLNRLSHELLLRGCPLVLRSGDSRTELQELIRETHATAIVWNRRYEPAVIARDATLKEDFKSAGLTVESFNGSLLTEPWKAAKADGTPYQVYTPFWRNLNSRGFGENPQPAPARIQGVSSKPRSLSIDELGLLPSIRWDGGFSIWTPGEQGAQARLAQLLEERVTRYSDTRNLPGVEGTSRLSPHLHFGEISPHQIVHAVREKFPGSLPPSVETFVKEVVWREFGYHLLFYFPETPLRPLHKKYEHFPWISDALALKAWQRGRTGYPIVDAGMRELWATGWMHNRVRMVVSSFLVKHLLLPWQEGAKWFWDTLVDADLASNTLGWQWSAGCGADAAPYFRIFNPVLQGEKFDADGDYVKRWCPELQGLSKKFIHKPWEAPAGELAKAGIHLGVHYPRPIVDHGFARKRALEALAKIGAGAQHSEESD